MPVQVEDLLTDSQVRHIVDRCVGFRWEPVSCDLRPAVDGLAGFVGDHSRLTVQVQLGEQLQTLKLFVKSVPRHNAAKTRFIVDNGFFVKEMTVFKLIEEMEIGTDPCVVKALFYSDSMLVMPDLAAQGYSICNQLETFDLQHILVTLTSVARFHAGSANLETKKSLASNGTYSLMEDYGPVAVETTFKDTLWTRAAAKLTANIIQRLSKYRELVPDLEASVLCQFLAGCEDLTDKNSLNVVLHKDLWVNNIMFKYENGVPTSSILVDFQCVRYGPPAFDVTMLLYLTTSRSFRQQEDLVFRHYFKVFTECLTSDTKKRLKGLGYDYQEFLRWVEFSRRFGMVTALAIFPFVLMDPATASRVFDDPQTYDELMYKDRTEAVLAHVATCPQYGNRQLEVTEEFVERFLLA